MQISARTPATTALTALSMAQISNDRFTLGLGVSGPQVVEGLHGDEFAHPLGRLREYVDIVRQGLRGERLQYDGTPLHAAQTGRRGQGAEAGDPAPARPADLPRHARSRSRSSSPARSPTAGSAPRSSPSTPTCCSIPSGPARTRAGRSIDEIDIVVSAPITVSDDVDALITKAKPGMAFTLGGMGSATTNFYNASYSRAGFGDIAAHVQRTWVDGDKAAAAAAVPDELVLLAYPIGTEEMVRSRIRAYRDAGVTGLRLGPQGRTATEQIAHLEMVIDLVRSAVA